MKNISKILLLSTSCIICYGASDVCASFISDTVPRSGIHIYTTQPHLTSGYPHLSHPLAQSNNKQHHPQKYFQSDAVTSGASGKNIEALFDLDCRIKSEHDVRVASVCFITDAGNCSGNRWSSGDEPNTPPPPGPLGPDIPEIDPIIKCKELGYTQAASGCKTGYSPEGHCPFDSSMVKKCICSEECPHNYQKQPCSSGMIQTGETTPNCQKCYKCTACEDVCPNGYSLEKGVCNEASAYKTECGSSCYKIVSNICSSGSLEAPAENENQKNKIVAYTNCKKPCFKSFSDVCPNGYSKISASSGKCYDTANTDFGTICRKEIKCCTPLSSERNCTYGEQSCSDGCGGTRTCCKSAPPRPTCRTCWHSCRYTSQKVNTNQTQHMAWCSSTTTCSDGSSRTGGGVHGYVTGVNNGGKMCYSPECDGLLKQAVINHINNGDYDGCE